MSMERSRRERFAPQTVPLTWEIPVATVAAIVLLVVFTPLVVQAAVGWVLSGEFAWPTNHLGPALLGLLRGRFGVGLPAGAAAGLPADGFMLALAAIGEAIVLVAALVAGLWMREALGGSRIRHGLATSAQAREALGIPRLRASAAVIRPDLYSRGSHRDRT